MSNPILRIVKGNKEESSSVKAEKYSIRPMAKTEGVLDGQDLAGKGALSFEGEVLNPDGIAWRDV